MVLTQVEFPGMYERQIRLDPAPLLVISARNVLLAAAFALVVASLWRMRGKEPGAAPGPIGPPA
jgi:hypothetical protein